MAAAATTAAALLLQATINHVVLPPRLPSRADRNIEAIEISLLDRLIQAVRQIVAQQPEKRVLDAWETVQRSLQAYKHIHTGGKLYKDRLLSALRELQSNDLIIVYIFEQNAALTIRRDKQKQEDLVIFEAFEASALSKDVLAAGPALQWDFPGCSVSMDFSNFDDNSFQNELVSFLDRASTESIKSFAPLAFKSGTTIFESRDTVDPTMITQILMTLLETLGQRIYPTLLRKRVRDEVNWSDGALKPWRRSPVWLLLRVSIQRYMATILGNEVGRCQYKFFMCLALAQLVQDARFHIPEEKVDLVHFSKVKMCRRIAKLKLEMEEAISEDSTAAYVLLFEKFEPTFKTSESIASQYIDAVWARVMKAPALGCRVVPNLPYYAEARDLQLTLLNSGRYLRRALEQRPAQPDGFSGGMSISLDLSLIQAKPSSKFASQYFATSKIEQNLFQVESLPQVENLPQDENIAQVDGDSHACIRAAMQIEQYIKSVNNTYSSSAEQTSIMILNLMDLWVAMDKSAITTFPLLREFNPWFTVDLLDVLQLWRVSDMDRLHHIRSYINVRTKLNESRASRLTIFSDPETGCFAERYYEDSPDSAKFLKLRETIQEGAEQQRLAKEQEWHVKTEEYAELSRQVAESSHVNVPGQYGDFHDSKACTKCFLERKTRRVTIDGLEYPLPSNELQAKVVIFELACPLAFARYRVATWKICKLAFSKLNAEIEHKWLLQDYTGLRSYARGMPKYGFSLGSKKKSWLITHYSKNIRFPVAFEDVYHYNGMSFNYLDLEGDLTTRPSAQGKPSFAHLFGLQIPRTSPFWPLRAQCAADSEGISSYQIIASQGLCPSTLNVHEYMAYQTLASGRTRRWPQLLVELGSNNLNFSSEAVAILIRRISLQAGPYSPQSALGNVHNIFGDSAFCKMLLHQIDQRLEGLSTNWRETVAMETLITLALRVFAFGADIQEDALTLIYKIRNITHQWIILLRMEFVNATDSEAIQRSSNYGLWAALLCKRTYEVYCNSKLPLVLSGIQLQVFVEASTMLQDNLINDPVILDLFLKNAIIRDVKMTFLIRDILRSLVIQSPGSIVDALVSAWPMFGASRPFSKVEFLQDDDYWWILVELPPTMYESYAIVHIHLLEGHLLLMGTQLGRLPPEWKASGILKDLFPGQNLLTYPSQMYGMTYALALQISGHSFHIGFRDGELILKAYFDKTVLEFIPRSKFQNALFSDLPGSLIDDCTHWLDLNTGVLEVRPSSHMWRRKESNWFLNIRSGRVSKRNTALVDTLCGLFTRICNLFADFETARNILVYQPARGPLVVELRRLELSFFVNQRHLLESRQLRAEFDQNQDAGTWYGLVSKIVLKSVIKGPHTVSTPHTNRSIIVPMGAITYKRIGPHVSVRVANTGAYGRFFINDTLCRLECAAEPRIIYLKAMYHAYTSFFCPDPLTHRTGTEESVQCLSAGYSQPWTPLGVTQDLALPVVAALTPHRDYYPKHLKVMQIVSWNENLPTTLQDGRFRAIVDSIQQKSKDLSLFAKDPIDLPDLEASGDPHLTQRGQYRFYATGEQIHISDRHILEDTVYASRDKIVVQDSRSRIMDTANLLLQWPSLLQATPDLITLLHTLPQPCTIAGFSVSLEMALLTDVLEIDLVTVLGPLILFCQGLEAKDRYKAMFWFAVVAFGHGSSLDSSLLRVLLAFTVIQDLKQPSTLKWPSYEGFRREQQPTLATLTKMIRPSFLKYTKDYRDVTSDETEFSLSSKLYRKLQALQKDYEMKQEKNSTSLCEHLLSQWPCSNPSVDDFLPPTTPLLIELPAAMICIRQEWLRLFKNWELLQYLSSVQRTLAKRTAMNSENVRIDVIESIEQDVFPSTTKSRDFVGLSTLLRRIPTCKNTVLPDATHGSFRNPIVAKRFQPRLSGLSYEAQRLTRIVNELTSNSSSAVRQQYGTDLQESIEALGIFVDQDSIIPDRKFDPMRHQAEMVQAKTAMSNCLATITRALELNTVGTSWHQKGNLWPVVSPVTVLENLRSKQAKFLSETVRSDLVKYAISITSYQRLFRISDAHQKHNRNKVIEETSNRGHTNWNPNEYTDWLLLEIDSNLLLRPSQIDVAHATINPSSGNNSILQMNMGQGKTSCIIPMSISVLADGRALARIILPSSLLLQTAQLLQSRLGGLIGREIIHVPFSRRTSTGVETTKKYWQLHNSTRRHSGVVLALPEHILSFKLSGLQQLSDDRIPEAKAMIDAQNWFSQWSRDVMDEADSILAIRTQLIYPSGAQKTVDGHPHRWTVTQMILHQVLGHLWGLQNTYPHSIEVLWRSNGSFPMLSFLRKDAEQDLLCKLIDDIHKGRTAILPQDIPRVGRDLIKKFISEPQVSSEDEQTIRDMFPDKPAVKQAVFLLRGLIVHRILLMTLKKRWNVQYGLHPARDPIAVPFINRLCPSNTGEWGHPDVAILFTCLSFYYQGLTEAQFCQTLEHVLKSDDPAQVFDRFASDANIYQDWTSLNVEDKVQINNIWMQARSNMTIVDYFLNNFVFPRHAKQFRLKLQASGWDLPLFTVQTKSSLVKGTSNPQPLTTGFSGTNDWKRMLPLTISQRDLPGLVHTNAEVLTYLLQARNRRCVRAANDRGDHLTEQGLLRLISAEKIRVLIDAGAAILEMTNLDLVKAWLDIDAAVSRNTESPEAQAAVYFNDDNKAMVYYRSGVRIPLIASTFADDLTGCLVYLDEAHTRGTDLKISPFEVGALTIGLGQTKDQTVQAAMRLRQLGTTQSIRFFIPPGVLQSIIDLRGLEATAFIDSTDVIYWLLVETCNGIEQLQPLHFSQGADFCRRYQAILDNPDSLSNTQQRETLLESLRQIELQSLEKMYGVSSKAKASKTTTTIMTSSDLKGFMRELKLSKKSFQDTGGNAVHGSALQEVEQEREVAHEVETVREVQKIVKYNPFSWSGLHREIEHFVNTGRLTADAAGYELAFAAFERTTLGKKFHINRNATSGHLFVSKQFSRTVNLGHGISYDNFQRNVSWVLWSSVNGVAMVVIPEEAEEILKILGKTSPTHLVAYSASVTRKMLHFSDLRYFAVPPLPQSWTAEKWLKTELLVFAGGLYFDYDDYVPLLEFLGIENNATLIEEDLEDLEISSAENLSSAEVHSGHQKDLNASIPKFARKPLTFLQEWLALSRKAQDVSQTPMGYLSQGKPLMESHPFFMKDANSIKEGHAAKHVVGKSTVEVQDDDAQDGFLDEEHYFDAMEQVKDTFDYSELANEKRVELHDDEQGIDEAAHTEAALKTAMVEEAA